MATVTVTFHTARAVRAIEQLGAKAPRVIARALNRTAASVRTVMSREIASDTGLKVGMVRGEIKIVEASTSGPRQSATVSVSGKRIPLIDFNARGPEPSRGRGRGVRAGLKGGRRSYPQAFIATTRSGHRGVFTRKGRLRLPIRELFGPSLPHVFTKFIPVGMARGEEQLLKNLEHEFRFALGQAAT